MKISTQSKNVTLEEVNGEVIVTFIKPIDIVKATASEKTFILDIEGVNRFNARPTCQCSLVTAGDNSVEIRYDPIGIGASRKRVIINGETEEGHKRHKTVVITSIAV